MDVGGVVGGFDEVCSFGVGGGRADGAGAFVWVGVAFSTGVEDVDAYPLMRVAGNWRFMVEENGSVRSERRG